MEDRKTCLNPSNDLITEPSSLKTDWLDSEEAAEYLRVSVETLRNMASNGQVTFYKLGRRNRYKRSDLETLMHKKRQGSNGN